MSDHQTQKQTTRRGGNRMTLQFGGPVRELVSTLYVVHGCIAMLKIALFPQLLPPNLSLQILSPSTSIPAVFSALDFHAQEIKMLGHGHKSRGRPQMTMARRVQQLQEGLYFRILRWFFNEAGSRDWHHRWIDARTECWLRQDGHMKRRSYRDRGRAGHRGRGHRDYQKAATSRSGFGGRPHHYADGYREAYSDDNSDGYSTDGDDYSDDYSNDHTSEYAYEDTSECSSDYTSDYSSFYTSDYSSSSAFGSLYFGSSDSGYTLLISSESQVDTQL